jgi:NADH:ubiquinone oxidoreductase subunit 2 (subunit N)
VLTVVALYYYLLVARQMYIEAPGRRGPVRVPAVLAAGIGLCALGVVGIGLYPRSPGRTVRTTSLDTRRPTIVAMDGIVGCRSG